MLLRGRSSGLGCTVESEDIAGSDLFSFLYVDIGDQVEFPDRWGNFALKVL